MRTSLLIIILLIPHFLEKVCSPERFHRGHFLFKKRSIFFSQYKILIGWQFFLKGELFFSEKNCTLDHFSFMTTALGVMSTNLFPVIVPRISHVSCTHSRKHRNEWDPQAQRVNTFAVITPVFHDGQLSAFPAHSQTFKPTQASFTHINNQTSHSIS